MTTVLTYSTARPPTRKASAPVDPIYAAIAAYERAEAAFSAVAGEEDGLNAKLRPIEERHGGVDFTTHFQPAVKCGIGNAVFTSEAEVKRFFAGEIKNGRPPVSITKAQWRAGNLKGQAKALASFRKAQRDVKRLQDKHGWTDFLRRYEETLEASEAALLKAVRTAPTTHAGLGALAQWASKHCEDRLQGTRWNATELLFGTIARAAKRLDKTAIN